VFALLNSESAPVFSRYTSYGNLAHCLYHLDEITEGIHFARQALNEMTHEFFQQDPHSAVLLHRNCIRLYLAAGNMQQAKVHVEQLQKLVEKTPSPRGAIAAATSRPLRKWRR
jgi:hypothetical protein